MPAASARIGHIDAMRGFIMLMVVLGHVLYFSFGTGFDTVTGGVMYLLTMPCFFFISGYVCYKSPERQTARFFLSRVWQKAVTLLLPAVVFFCVYAVVFGLDIRQELTAAGMGRYWFTVALFNMLAVNYVLLFLSGRVGEWLQDVSMAALLVGSLLFSLFVKPWHNPSLLVVEAYRTLFHIQFFAFGYLCRRHNAAILRLCRNGLFTAAVIIVFTASAIVQQWPSGVPQWLDWLTVSTARYSGMLTVFAFFLSKETFFAGLSVMSRSLRFIGRRTLDIYLLHYFFLPVLTAYSMWVLPSGEVLKQLAVGGAITVAVVAVSLLTGAVLRTSPLLARCVLGNK